MTTAAPQKWRAAAVTGREAASGGAVVLTICDVTDESAVQSWAKQVSEALGDDGLDVLVNNAGILTPGPLELLPLDAIKHEFDVNVFGSLAVIHAFLPALRKARGRILQIGSMSGRFPLPFNGPSSASKAALEAFADVYRRELKPFDINFVMIQPGSLATGGPAKTATQLEARTRAANSSVRDRNAGCETSPPWSCKACRRPTANSGFPRDRSWSHSTKGSPTV
jgi:NAD(P)-dependent dehydrogenase (short-subunit alcohol dehydrogenase family)